MSLVSISSSWVIKLEWPEEVVGGLEVWSTGGNFVDEVLNTGDSDLSQLLLDNSVVAEWDSSSLNSDESSLVDEFLDGGDRGISVGDIWFDLSEHVGGGLVDTDEGGVVDLSDSQETEDSDDVWVQFSGSSDSDDSVDLWLVWDVERSGSLGSSLGINILFNLSLILLLVGLGLLDPAFSKNLDLSSSSSSQLISLSLQFGISGGSLLVVFRNSLLIIGH